MYFVKSTKMHRKPYPVNSTYNDEPAKIVLLPINPELFIRKSLPATCR